MKKLAVLTLAVGQGFMLAAQNLSVADVIVALEAPQSYKASAAFTVSMPQMPDDVNYTIDFESRQAGGSDPLSPIDYLIDWRILNQQSASKGFSAYYDGNHFRYNGGGRLQEYHFQWDSIPFMDRTDAGRYYPSIQKSAQFANFLPAYIASDLRRWASDSTYHFHAVPDTIVGGVRYASVKGVRKVDDVVVQELEFLLDSATKLPVRIVLENNPGSLSEQTVTMAYTPLEGSVEKIDEDRMIATYPDVFERYREGNFRVEALIGDYLPAFSLPSATGERYSRERRSPFRSPVAILFYEPGQGFAVEAINALRSASDELPYSPSVVFVALSSNIDRVDENVGNERPGESSLISGNGFARDCGVTTTPVVIIADSSGKVTDVVIGYNKTLQSDVIEKMIGLN